MKVIAFSSRLCLAVPGHEEDRTDDLARHVLEQRQRSKNNCLAQSEPSLPEMMPASWVLAPTSFMMAEREKEPVVV